MSLLPFFIPTPSGFYLTNITNSCKFDKSVGNQHIYRTPVATGNRRLMTLHCAVKRGALNGGSGYQYFMGSTDGSGYDNGLHFGPNDNLRFNHAGNENTFGFTTTQVFKDTSAWYWITLILDTENATASERIRLYVNGSRVTSFSSYTATQNTDLNLGVTGWNQFFGLGYYGGAYGPFDGYIADVHWVNGLALDPASFGQFKDNVWTPKQYAGSYGTNGLHLEFKDSGSLGLDTSGNGNTCNVGGMSNPVQSADTPMNNYATLNPLDKSGSLTLTNANTRTSGGVQYTVRATMEAFGGAYFETSVESVGYLYVGLGTKDMPLSGGTSAYFYGAYHHSPNNLIYIYKAGTLMFNVSGTGWGIGYVWRFAYKNGNLWIGNASGWLDSSGGFTGDPAAGANPTMTGVPTSTLFPTFNNQSATYLFKSGAMGFTYTLPTGFKALCTANLDDPPFTNSKEGFEALTRTGTGVSTNVQTSNIPVSSGALVVSKARDAAEWWNWFDTERGAGKGLHSNQAVAEGTYTQELTAFLSNGYTVVNGLSEYGMNISGRSYVDYVIRKGAKYGIDVMTWTGDGTTPRSIPHSLGAVPEMGIVKCRSYAYQWPVYHKALPTAYALYLNSTNAQAIYAQDFPAAHTATHFVVGCSTDVNYYGQTYVAYLFRSIPGFSKVFGYTGNGSTDGTFVHLGFKPAFVLLKCTSNAGTSWGVFDMARDTYNPEIRYIFANESTVEQTSTSYYALDAVANGLKFRQTHTPINASGYTYIGIAFAQSPFKYANAQ